MLSRHGQKERARSAKTTRENAIASRSMPVATYRVPAIAVEVQQRPDETKSERAVLASSIDEVEGRRKPPGLANASVSRGVHVRELDKREVVQRWNCEAHAGSSSQRRTLVARRGASFRYGGAPPSSLPIGHNCPVEAAFSPLRCRVGHDFSSSLAFPGMLVAVVFCSERARAVSVPPVLVGRLFSWELSLHRRSGRWPPSLSPPCSPLTTSSLSVPSTSGRSRLARLLALALALPPARSQSRCSLRRSRAT